MTKPAEGSAATPLQTLAYRKRAEALEAYIREAKSSAIVADITWDSVQWKGFGVFVKHGRPAGQPKKNIEPAFLLDSAFVEFSKAYIVERHSHNPGEARSQHIQRFAALRLTEAVLLKLHGKADPLLIDRDTLDQAVVLARSHYDRQTLYQAGRALEQMASALVEHQVLPLELRDWVNPLPAYRSVGTTVGSAGDKARQSKLPDADALEVLAAIFNRDLDTADQHHQHRDIYTTSVAALLLCAPSRGEEIHRLPANLLVKATDSFGEEQTGLRLHASKGFGAYVKWVWAGMVPVAKKAIDRLLTITDEPRKLALHLENPKTRNRFFRHAACPAVADDEPLTAEQAAMALGKPLASLHAAGLSSAAYAHTLQSLWNDWVLPRHAKRAPYFPYVSKKDKALGAKGGLKFSDALFCMRAGQLGTFSTSRVLLWMPSLGTGFSPDVAPSRENYSVSIFERYGYTGPNGAPLKLNSHQLRHLLNTEAQRASLSDDMIAHWSGRLNIRQNETYDNRPEQERVDQVRPVVEALEARLGAPAGDGEEVRSMQWGPWSVEPFVKPRSCSDLDDIQPRLAGIKTEYGECYHDWALAPCEGLIACLECDEHACIKGADELGRDRLGRVQNLYRQVLAEVDKAQAAVGEKDWGAEEWLRMQQRYAAKLEELIKVLTSADVPDGSVIRAIGAQPPTHLHRVLRGIAVKALEDGTSSSEAMVRVLTAVSHKEHGTQPIMVHPPSQLKAIMTTSSSREADGT
ncbi:MAG: hypothetical protein EKK53_28220 [Burkholderiales bacterium]|jgi:hypothetical protein|nr:MAG: hypothetical protein EKK53_28220 [Burkholderiales bacterium]